MGKEPGHAFRLVDEIRPSATPAAPVKGRRGTATERPPSTGRTAVHALVPAESRTDELKGGPVGRSVTSPATPAADGVSDPVEAAVARGLRLLAYGDMSRCRLVRKLNERGVPPDTAEQAADILETSGYLREADACLRRAEQGARKGWGKRRIAEDLYAQRYPRELVEEVMDTLSDEVNFADACAAVIRKKYRTVPTDSDSRRRMTASLARLGYSMEDIRAAIQTVVDGDS